MFLGLLLVGCSDSNSGVSFEDFEARVARTAGTGAIDCGTASVEVSRTNFNTCVAGGFQSATGAYAIYIGQGTDSTVAGGLATDRDMRVTILRFDSDPTGGGSPNNGNIRETPCENATLSGAVDGPYQVVFACDNIEGP